MRRIIAADDPRRAAAQVREAMRGGAEIVLQNTRLTAQERAAQLAAIDSFPPAGEPAEISLPAILHPRPWCPLRGTGAI